MKNNGQIYTRFMGVKIGLIAKSGSFVATYRGRVFYTPSLAGMVKVLQCEIR